MENIIIEGKPDKKFFDYEVRSIIGGRENQQDQVYLRQSNDELFAVICDGMGGASFGREASKAAIVSFRESYLKSKDHLSLDEVPSFFHSAMVEANRSVLSELHNSAGGTTAVSVFIRGDKLFWLSVGDSRLYIKRAGELLQVTRDHNYFLRLDEQLKEGVIDEEIYQREAIRGEALLSYLGKDFVSLFDLTERSFTLCSGDMLLLTSDGLSRAVSEESMLSILEHGGSLQNCADELLCAVTGKLETIMQDNTSFIIILIS